ncbi:UBX domain-containing protein 8 [Apodemus speciosus]|uniref:UBX domain-containing protein 8 n=1 Tax=Apodemus speciosus TaxID=105296 RepID=A0ABQ0F1C5_APOSI
MFLLLALLTLVISVTTSWFNSPKPSRVHLKDSEREKENERRQRLARERQQEAQGEKLVSLCSPGCPGTHSVDQAGLELRSPPDLAFKWASRYIQNVLKPQQELKLRKLEERFYQMTGETWKLTTGHRLEGNEDSEFENSSQASFETTNGEAARRQNLPKSSTDSSPPAQAPRKKVPDLPEEPSETAEEGSYCCPSMPKWTCSEEKIFQVMEFTGLT